MSATSLYDSMADSNKPTTVHERLDATKPDTVCLDDYAALHQRLEEANATIRDRDTEIEAFKKRHEDSLQRVIRLCHETEILRREILSAVEAFSKSQDQVAKFKNVVAGGNGSLNIKGVTIDIIGGLRILKVQKDDGGLFIVKCGPGIGIGVGSATAAGVRSLTYCAT